MGLPTERRFSREQDLQEQWAKKKKSAWQPQPFFNVCYVRSKFLQIEPVPSLQIYKTQQQSGKLRYNTNLWKKQIKSFLADQGNCAAARANFRIGLSEKNYVCGVLRLLHLVNNIVQIQSTNQTVVREDCLNCHLISWITVDKLYFIHSPEFERDLMSVYN